jgi:two-component system chemotaxis sensor kinase CheA
MDPLLQVFFDEASELLGDAEEALVQLEKTPKDGELLNRIFRCVHTLKGNSAMLGFSEISHFTHALEDLLDQLRKGVLAVHRPVVDVLLASQDSLRTMLARAHAGETPADAEEITAVQIILKNIQDILAGGARGEEPGAIQTNAPQESAAPTGLFREASVDEPMPFHMVDVLGRPGRRITDRDEASSIRVPIERVDRLLNLIGELVITQSIVSQTVTAFTPEKLELLQEAVAQMDRHARELHERMMAIRMVPLRQLFGRFPRLARDLAATIGKQVELRISGEETELDKTVIERISDPLTHLIRNALDHGLENPAQRRQAGKSETGSLSLNAYQQGGSIYIEVTDDGRGLDPDRLVARARAMGLIGPDQNLSQDEIFALIGQPGFTTAEQITEISGRGVGMNVVKRNLEALGGSITIQSERGQGTTFRIKLPLTVAIVDGQAVQVGDQVYLMPLVSILESVRPAAGSVHTVPGGGEVVLVRGQSLPLLRLHRLFGVKTEVVDPTRALVVIVEHENRQAAVLIEEILGQQQVVIKSLENNYQKVPGIAGATILGDGRVALILDVPGLMALSRSGGSPTEFRAA